MVSQCWRNLHPTTVCLCLVPRIGSWFHIAANAPWEAVVLAQVFELLPPTVTINQNEVFVSWLPALTSWLLGTGNKWSDGWKLLVSLHVQEREEFYCIQVSVHSFDSEGAMYCFESYWVSPAGTIEAETPRPHVDQFMHCPWTWWSIITPQHNCAFMQFLIPPFLVVLPFCSLLS